MKASSPMVAKWCTPHIPLMVARRPTRMCPASWLLLPSTTRSPSWQSWATCAPARGAVGARVAPRHDQAVVADRGDHAAAGGAFADRHVLVDAAVGADADF